MFVVYLLGGLAVALGPGELLLDLVPHPRPELKYLFEIIGGVVLLTLAMVLWSFRKLLAKRRAPRGPAPTAAPARSSAPRSPRVELPTAFPYFAAIAAVVGSGYGVWHQVFLILIFNVAFVLPLLAIIAVLQFAGPNAQRMLIASREWLERHWPVTLAVIGLIAGLFCVFIGITGLVGLHHTTRAASPAGCAGSSPTERGAVSCRRRRARLAQQLTHPGQPSLRLRALERHVLGDVGVREDQEPLVGDALQDRGGDVLGLEHRVGHHRRRSDRILLERDRQQRRVDRLRADA